MLKNYILTKHLIISLKAHVGPVNLFQLRVKISEEVATMNHYVHISNDINKFFKHQLNDFRKILLK